MKCYNKSREVERVYYDGARKIDSNELPDFDFIVFLDSLFSDRTQKHPQLCQGCLFL